MNKDSIVGSLFILNKNRYYPMSNPTEENEAIALAESKRADYNMVEVEFKLNNTDPKAIALKYNLKPSKVKGMIKKLIKGEKAAIFNGDDKKRKSPSFKKSQCDDTRVVSNTDLKLSSMLNILINRLPDRFNDELVDLQDKLPSLPVFHFEVSDANSDWVDGVQGRECPFFVSSHDYVIDNSTQSICIGINDVNTVKGVSLPYDEFIVASYLNGKIRDASIIVKGLIFEEDGVALLSITRNIQGFSYGLSFLRNGLFLDDITKKVSLNAVLFLHRSENSSKKNIDLISEENAKMFVRLFTHLHDLDNISKMVEGKQISKKKYDTIFQTDNYSESKPTFVTLLPTVSQYSQEYRKDTGRKQCPHKRRAHTRRLPNNDETIRIAESTIHSDCYTAVRTNYFIETHFKKD
jgi:hypothetical protein